MLRSAKHCLPFIVVSFGFLVFMSSVALSGDEKTYAKGANNLLLYLLGRRELDDIIRNGWFMPGMSFVLAPVQAVFLGEAPVVALRGYMYVLNIFLIIYINWKLFISKGNILGSYITQAVMAANIYYPMAIASLWSEVLALHLGIALFLSVADIRARLSDLVFAFLMGVACFGLVYVRPIFLAAPLFIVLTVVIGQWSGWRSFRQSLPRLLIQLAVISAVMLALLMPWSMAVSSKFGPTLTLTGKSMSRIIFLADRDDVVELIGDEVLSGNIFVNVHEYILKQADENNLTYTEQGQLIYEEAVEGEDITEKTRQNFSRYFVVDDAEAFPMRFVELYCGEDDACIFTDRLRSNVSAYIQYVWYVTALLGALLFLLPRGLDRENLYGSFLFKGLVVLVCLHPLLGYVHPRYYSQLILLIALACGTFKYSETRLFWSNLVRPQGVSIVEVGQIVCWLAAVALAFVWLTGLNPLF